MDKRALLDCSRRIDPACRNSWDWVSALWKTVIVTTWYALCRRLLCDRSQISVDPRHCKSSWNDLIGNANVEGITPIRLRQRLLLLSSELDGLIELADKNYSLFQVPQYVAYYWPLSFSTNYNLQIIFQQYRDQHDFNKYVIWFNQWARDLLSRNASYEASQILRLGIAVVTAPCTTFLIYF